MPRCFQIGDCLAFPPHLCLLVRTGRNAQEVRAEPRRRAPEGRTADRSPARRGDVSDEHDASRPASLTFISPRIFGKREGTAHNIRALPRRAEPSDARNEPAAPRAPCKTPRRPPPPARAPTTTRGCP